MLKTLALNLPEAYTALHVRSLVNDRNEGFHAKIRGNFSDGMPTLLEVLRVIPALLDEQLDSILSLGIDYYTGRYSQYQVEDCLKIQGDDLRPCLERYNNNK
jgi:hypothetical protein